MLTSLLLFGLLRQGLGRIALVRDMKEDGALC